jgi:hypothetical protein
MIDPRTHIAKSLIQQANQVIIEVVIQNKVAVNNPKAIEIGKSLAEQVTQQIKALGVQDPNFKVVYNYS